MEGADKTPISMEKVAFKKLICVNFKYQYSQAINIIHDVFISAAEREIHTGDGISLKVLPHQPKYDEHWLNLLFKAYLIAQVITKDGIKCQELPLRRD